MIRHWIFGSLIFKQTLGEAAELAIKRSVSCAGPRLGADRRPCAGPRLGADRRPSEAGHREPIGHADDLQRLRTIPELSEWDTCRQFF